MFDKIIHADWSVAPNKRWVAMAHRRESTWQVEAPRPVGDCGRLLSDALGGETDNYSVLAGFDFPIGVPVAYGRKTRCTDFKAFLRALGNGCWQRFFDVCEKLEEISVTRPFYPNSSGEKGVRKREHLLSGLWLSKEELLRQCEKKTDTRNAACSLFWTLGGNQVGKAALAGWHEVVRPALDCGGRLWPFEGSLGELAGQPGLVICETYPGEAYGHLGIKFNTGLIKGKRDQTSRQKQFEKILTWLNDKSIKLAPEVEACIRDGFGSEKNADDKFDAFVGLLSMIDVAEGQRSEGLIEDKEIRVWEGWILGQP